MVSKQRVFVTADRKRAVPESSPDAAYLLIHEGGEIHPEELAKYTGAEALCGKAAPKPSTVPLSTIPGHPLRVLPGHEDAEDGLDSLNKADLLTLAQSEQIDIGSSKTKADLLARVRSERKAKRT
jgi:hypothetical protein